MISNVTVNKNNLNNLNKSHLITDLKPCSATYQSSRSLHFKNLFENEDEFAQQQLKVPCQRFAIQSACWSKGLVVTVFQTVTVSTSIYPTQTKKQRLAPQAVKLKSTTNRYLLFARYIVLVKPTLILHTSDTSFLPSDHGGWKREKGGFWKKNKFGLSGSREMVLFEPLLQWQIWQVFARP